MTIALVFRTVPPFRQVARYFWRRLVTSPVKEWFGMQLHTAICPEVRKSVIESVPVVVEAVIPNAVASAVAAGLEVALRPIREGLHDHGERLGRIEAQLDKPLNGVLRIHRDLEEMHEEQRTEFGEAKTARDA